MQSNSRARNLDEVFMFSLQKQWVVGFVSLPVETHVGRFARACAIAAIFWDREG
jgi:hypothetical protein